METVAFYSYKGGVGRSLLLSNTARFLALSGRRVVALDLDFEAPGLHYKFRVDAKVKSGAVPLLLRSLDGDLPSLDDVRGASVEVPMPETHGGWLRLLAAGPAPSPEYWAELGRLHERLAVNLDVGLLEAVLNLHMQIENVWDPDVLLVDARTGITGLGGIATMALSDRVVLVTTRAKESLEGSVAVARSLRATPKLRPGERTLEFVVSRVQGTEAVSDRDLRDMLGDYSELPNDPYDGGAERLFGDGAPVRTWESVRRGSRVRSWVEEVADVDESPFDERSRSIRKSLLARTLEWISKIFPTHAQMAERARRRLVAVETAWLELTRPDDYVGPRSREVDRWSSDALEFNVRFEGQGEERRIADMVARFDTGELAMIIEYVDDEPHEAVVQWWREHVPARAIALLSAPDDPSQEELSVAVYPAKGQPPNRATTNSARADLPGPQEFGLLSDPTDLSIDALLEVVSRSALYDELLVNRWVRSRLSGVYGGASPWVEYGRRIVDGLAAIDDESRAAQVIAYSSSWSPDFSDIALNDYFLVSMVREELCAPLCWRAPPRTFVDLASDHDYIYVGPSPAFHALHRLAGFMGLQCRYEAVLQYEWSATSLDLPPTPEHLPPAADLLVERLCYQDYLGRYIPTTGRVVLASPTIEAAAESIERASRYVGSITLLHLSVLRILHKGIDLDGRRWEDFSTGDSSPSTGGLPPVIAALTQFFVYRFLVELDDQRLKDAFDALTDRQEPKYRAWRSMAHVSLEAGRAWMMALRRGESGSAPVDLDALL